MSDEGQTAPDLNATVGRFMEELRKSREGISTGSPDERTRLQISLGYERHLYIVSDGGQLFARDFEGNFGEIGDQITEWIRNPRKPASE